MSILQELVGRKVTVYSMADTERQDVGILQAADEHVLKIKKTETEVLYFNIVRVRLVKPFDPH
ncbi:hypothetical protein [Armatimonas sp.]|uniref:hypothetical protein n=1 Tax=Armatimonas sp. TaxID=1872638 RepID=UPI00286C2254|nr:hypothetical protein [Armatimonas sp.]